MRGRRAAGVAAALTLGLGAAGPARAEPALELSGAVAYTEVLRFDYNQDGHRNRVQFWLEFRGKGGEGKPGEERYRAPEGQLFYYLVDLDKKVNVPKWHLGFSMMEEPPPSGPYPMRGLVLEGHTARFEAFGMQWTVVDGGEGHALDTVTADDGFRAKPMRTYGGDVRVAPPR